MHKLKLMENMLWYAIYSNGGKTQGKSQKLVDISDKKVWKIFI